MEGSLGYWDISINVATKIRGHSGGVICMTLKECTKIETSLHDLKC